MQGFSDENVNETASLPPEATAPLSPPPRPSRVPHHAIGERPGDFIGPYKLLEIIGEGGFGTVFLAERREPMVQRVALKVIKPGMDTRAVVARFEQERQALAVMDHPNVAKVLDGGVTPTGRPFFVMEHVKGEPITAFCDRHRLTIKQRLELFIPVCEAVQHAHMKGIIHRDIKPSNILVAITGDADKNDAVVTHGMLVKVIDFGVAKAISHTLTDKTIFTEQGMIIGTPEYMSPEQAEMGAVDIDTRTDVYSLGAVLYELLSGTLPFDSKSLRSAGYAEIQRIIRDVDPPRPSTNLSTVDDATGAAIAKARQAEREKIAGELRRELEWIPLRAPRKDRSRRYTSAQALAADVRRYLDGRPLEAGPESQAYALTKLVRRHRLEALASGAVATALLIGLVTTLAQSREASRQRDVAHLEARRADERAEAATIAEAEARRQTALAEESGKVARRKEAVARAVQTFINDRLLSAIDPDRARGRVVTVQEVVDQAIAELASLPPDEPEVEFELRLTIGMLLCRLGRNEEGTQQFRVALEVAERAFGESSLEVARALQEMSGSGRAFALAITDSSAAARALERALQIRTQLLGPSDPLVLRTRADLAVARAHATDDLARDLDVGSLMLIALVRGKGESADQARAFVNDLFRRVTIATAAENLDEVDRILDQETEPFFRNPLTRDRVIAAVGGFSVMISRQGHHDAGQAVARAALRLAIRRSPTPTMDHALANYFCAEAARLANDTITAEEYYIKALNVGDQLGGKDHPWIAIATSGLAFAQFHNNKHDEAEKTCRTALAMTQRLQRGDSLDTARTMLDLGFILRERDKFEEAIQVLEECEAIVRRMQPDRADAIAKVLMLLGLTRIDYAHTPLASQMVIAQCTRAEKELLEAHQILVARHGQSFGDSRTSMAALAQLYSVWNTADPGRGYDQRAAEWNTTLSGAEREASASEINAD